MMAIWSEIRSAVIRAWKADEVFTNPRGWTANLAIFRIVFLSFAAMPWALRFLGWSEKILPGIPREMWVPVSFYRLLPIGLLANVPAAQALAIADIVLIILGIVGFCTRSSIGLATLISLYGFGLTQNIGKIDHFHHIIWFMALLAAGQSGHLFSIDALRQATHSADEGSVDMPFPPSAALWTLRYTWLMMGALYLVTGIAKLQSSLTDHWAAPPNLRNIMWQTWLAWYLYNPHFKNPIRVDSLPGFALAILGLSVVAFEVGFIFIVFFRRVRPALGLWGLVFHVGNGIVLKIWFTDLMSAYASLFDWNAMGRALSRRGPLLVFYDEECAFCRRTVAVLRSFDLFDALKPVPGVSTDPMRESYPQISGQMLTTDVYVADRGRIAFAYDAYAWIAKRMLLFWPIGAIMQIPFVARLGRRAYRRVADARHCTSAAPQAKRKAATLDTPSILIHRVGPALFGCQLAVSSLLLLYSLRDVYLPSNVPRLGAVRRLVNGFAKRRPVWPFDLYPTFTPATQSDLDIWEARWVTSNGREIRVSPTAYYSAFGNAGLAWNMTRWGIFRGGDPEESRARSLGLVRLLWQRELPSVQPNITGAKVYRVEYRLQPPAGRFPAALVAQRILYAFPLPSITGNSIRLSATVSQTASPPRNPPR